MPTQRWQDAFLGVSAVVGEPLEASLDALHGDPTFHEPELVRALQSTSRDVRARAIASALAAVVAGLDEIELR
jgi:hypothetical protein